MCLPFNVTGITLTKAIWLENYRQFFLTTRHQCDALLLFVPSPTQIQGKAPIQTALRPNDWPLVACFLPHISRLKGEKNMCISETDCVCCCMQTPHASHPYSTYCYSYLSDVLGNSFSLTQTGPLPVFSIVDFWDTHVLSFDMGPRVHFPKVS